MNGCLNDARACLLEPRTPTHGAAPAAERGDRMQNRAPRVPQALFDPSYTTDGVSPMHPWGRTRHALNPAVPILIDGFATELLDPLSIQHEINDIAGSYGELLQEHGVPGAGVALACAALRHAFDDTARWVVRRHALASPLATTIPERIARLAEGAIDVVNRSYDDRVRLRGGMEAHSPLPLKDLDLLAFAAATQGGTTADGLESRHPRPHRQSLSIES